MKPILFKGEMVRALLSGKKTQTRRIIKPQPTVCPHNPMYLDWSGLADGVTADRVALALYMPYQVGDLLWVRETWATSSIYDLLSPKSIPINGLLWFASEGTKPDHAGRWRRSIFMPRWASRITLKVTGVRIERVNQISEEEAIAEGVAPGFRYEFCGASSWHENRDEQLDKGVEMGKVKRTGPVELFAALWDSINGKNTGCKFADGPWTMVIEFERVK